MNKGMSHHVLWKVSFPPLHLHEEGVIFFFYLVIFWHGLFISPLGKISIARKFHMQKTTCSQVFNLLCCQHEIHFCIFLDAGTDDRLTSPDVLTDCPFKGSFWQTTNFNQQRHEWTKLWTISLPPVVKQPTSAKDSHERTQHWRRMIKIRRIPFRQPTASHIHQPTYWSEKKTILVSVFNDLITPHPHTPLPHAVGVLFVFLPPKCQDRDDFTLLLPIDRTWSLPGK